MYRLSLLVLVACKARTELLVGIATDLPAPGEMTEFQLRASRNDVPVEEKSFTLSGDRDVPSNLPASFGLYSEEGNEEPFTLDVVGYKNGTQFVQRHAVMGLIEGETLFYRMTLTSVCTAMTCPPNTTCAEGQCVPVEIDTHRLPAFEEALVTTLTCASNVHYIDTGTGEAMGYSNDAMQCPADRCHEGVCFTPPQMTGEPGADAGTIDPGGRDGGVMFPDGNTGIPDGGGPGGFTCNDDASIEPNNNVAQAYDTQIEATGPIGNFSNLAICGPGDVDIFRIDTIAAGRTIHPIVFGDPLVGGNGPLTVSILNAGGSVIVAGSPIGPTDSEAMATNVPMGTHHIKVTGAQPPNVNNYRLMVEVKM